MKTTTTIVNEYDKDGKLVKKTITRVKEEEVAKIDYVPIQYPVYPPYNPYPTSPTWISDTTVDHYPLTTKGDTDIKFDFITEAKI